MQEKLIGVRLSSDFVIESARIPTPQATGSCQSTGYIARTSDGRRAFVTVLDTTVDRDDADPLEVSRPVSMLTTTSDASSP